MFHRNLLISNAHISSISPAPYPDTRPAACATIGVFMSETRKDGVHSYVVCRIFGSGRSCQVVHRSFTGVIGRIRDTTPANPSNRRNVDYRAGSLILHDRKHVTHGVKHAHQINVHDSVPVSPTDIADTTHGRDPSIVVEHVNATMFRLDVCYDIRNLGLVSSCPCAHWSRDSPRS